MPTALSTIDIAKEQAATYQPLLLAEFTFADGAVLRLSTHPLNTSEGGVQYDGNDYLGRISEQTIQQVQALSETGVDLVPSVSLSIADPVAYIYSNWETAAGRGFKGATLTLRLVFYDVAGGTFSTDSRIPFVGICEKPASDAAKMTVSAVAKTSLMRAMLPIVPIQRRCPWINPTTTAQRAEAGNEDSCFYECGEARDTTTAPPCDYTLATCTQLTRFGGITYSAPAGMRVREYVSGNWSDVRGITNEASYGDRIPMLYGKAWIEPPVLTAIPDGNYLRGEVIVALGPVTIHKVLVNGIELSPANEPDGTPLGAANQDFRYNWINDGTRDGSPNLDTPWSGTGDPYGSMSVIMFVLPRSQGGGDGVPRVRVLASRKDLRKYQALTSVVVSSDVAVATLVGANVDIASNDPTWAFTISGTTSTDLNGDWAGLSDWTAGPPGTFTFATTGVADGTYTGGYVRFKSATENAVWAIADLLTWTNYRYEDLDLASFCAAAQVLEARPTAIVLRQRRSAAEIIRSIRQAHGLLLVPEHSTGKLHIYVKQTLADQQPATISGSNYDTAVASVNAAGTATNGYVAYKFDAASILRSDLPISLKELSRSQADSPNRISLSFQDRDNDYAISTLSVVDSDDAGRLEGQEIAGSLAVNADGLTSYADAMRSARVNLAEIHRGNTAADTRGTRVFEWDTTVRASHLRVGHIVLMTDTLKGLTNQALRITKIQPSQNYETVHLTAHWHDDNWYTDAYATTGALDATQYTPNAVSDANPLDIGGTVGSNLIRNAGFENGKAQWYGDIDNAAVTLVTDEYDTGLQCLKIAATGATEIHQPYEFQDGKYNIMTCDPGDAFTFKGRYKFDAGSAASTAQARIAFYQADGTFISAETATLDPADTDWTDFTLSATAPALSKYMGIFPWFGTLTAGAVYLDTLYAEKVGANSTVLPGHVSFTGVVTPVVEGVDQIELRAQVFNQFFVTAKAPNPLNGFNAVFVTHTDADAIVTPIGRIAVDSPTAGVQFTVSFVHNAPKSTSTETITVLAASDYGTADAATAPTATVDATGKADGADPPTGVTCTINEEDGGKYSITTDWSKPATEGGVIGYEILYEFYDAVGGLSFLITPFGGEDVIATIPAGSILGYDIETHQSAPADRGAAQWVRSFVRSLSAFGKFSAWAYSTVTVLDGESVPQPAVGDWAIVQPTAGDGYGNDGLNQKARLRINVIAIPTGADYVTAWVVIDGTYKDMLSADTMGNHDIWIDQPRTATTYDCKLVGNRRDAVKMPSAANDVKTFSVVAWVLPLPLTTFTVTLDTLPKEDPRNGTGKDMHRLKYAVTAPADINREGFAVFAAWADSDFDPVAGDDGVDHEISWEKSSLNSVTWYGTEDYSFASPPPGETNYKIFKAVGKNYAQEYDLDDAIVVETTFTSDGGWDPRVMDPALVGPGLFVDASGMGSLSRGLMNGDFEDQLKGWEASAGWTADVTEKYSGSYCAKFTANSAYGLLLQKIPCAPGMEYRFQAWARTTTNSNAVIYLTFYSEAMAWLVGEGASISGDVWTLYEATAKAPATAAYAAAYVECYDTSTTGRLLVDQCQLIKLEPTGVGVARDNTGVKVRVAPGTGLTVDATGIISLSRGLMNGDFENQLVGWEASTGWTADTSEEYSGAYCAKFTANAAYGLLLQYVSCAPGMEYRFQAWARESTNGSVAFYLVFYDEAGTWLSGHDVVAITGDAWTLYELIGTAPATASRIAVFVDCNANNTTGRVLVDQCQLIKIESIGAGMVRTREGVRNTSRDIKNTDFEDVQPDGTFADWLASAGVTVNTTDQYSGLRCAEITAAMGEYRSISQWAPVVPTWEIRWQVYARETLPNACYAAISFFNAAGGFISNKLAVISGDTWASYQVASEVPALAAQVLVEVLTGNDSATGRILVDQVRLIAVEPVGSGVARDDSGVHTTEKTLKNGNFTDQLKDWTATAQWAANTAEAYEGTAAKCTCNGSDQSIYQALPAVPGQIVQFEAYLKESGNSTSSMALRWHNAAGAYLSEAPATVTGDAYALYRVVGTAPAGAASVRCQITVPAANTSGRVMFDNANAKYLEPTGSGMTRTSAGIVPDLDPAGRLLVDGGGKLTAYALTELAKWGISSSDFESSGGYLVIKAAVIERLLAQSVTITSDLTVTRSSGGSFKVGTDGITITGTYMNGTSSTARFNHVQGLYGLESGSPGESSGGLRVYGGTLGGTNVLTCTGGSGTGSITTDIPDKWRIALALGDSATKNVGTGSGDVAAGNHDHTGLNDSFVADGYTWTITNGRITAKTAI